jgi:uncharacterized membrane protein YfhO
MLSPTYDPQKLVVVQDPTREEFQADSGNVECRSADIEILHSASHAQEYAVSANCDGYLVFSEPLYPGWKVKVDGKPSQNLPANLAFSAIFLSEGEHRLQRSYFPKSLLFGALLSLIFCSLLGIGLYLSRGKSFLS